LSGLMAVISRLGKHDGYIHGDPYTNYVNFKKNLKEHLRSFLNSIDRALTQDVSKFLPFLLGTREKRLLFFEFF